MSYDRVDRVNPRLFTAVDNMKILIAMKYNMLIVFLIELVCLYHVLFPKNIKFFVTYDHLNDTMSPVLCRVICQFDAILKIEFLNTA